MKKVFSSRRNVCISSGNCPMSNAYDCLRSLNSVMGTTQLLSSSVDSSGFSSVDSSGFSGDSSGFSGDSSAVVSSVHVVAPSSIRSSQSTSVSVCNMKLLVRGLLEGVWS